MGVAYGVASFVGKSGMTYNVSTYFDDTPGNPVRFSQAGKAGAGSATDWTPSEAVALVDFCLLAASAQTMTQLLRNGQPTGDMLLNALHLAAIATRPALRVVFSPMARVSAIQLA